MRKEPYNIYKIPLGLDEYIEALKEDSTLLSQPRTLLRELYKEKEKEREITEEVFQKTREKAVQEMVKTLSSEMEPLREIGTEVVGDLFDRIEFLKTRVIEVRNAVKERKLLSNEILKEIEEDVAEKKSLISGHSKFEELREISMDMQLLRMERRKENINCLRDMINLKRELTELEEEYRAESKIAKLFSKIKGN